MASTITTFSHLKIPLEDILEATNNFDDKKVIGHGGLGKVYKGRILRSGKRVTIAARRLDSKHKHGIEFLTEISVLSTLKHENIVSFIGFCDEKGEKVIVNKHEAKGSLVMHLSNPILTWVQRLRICVGVARALSYIHKGNTRGYSIIHRNINSSTILLDRNFEPKLSGFEYSINHSIHRMDEVLLSEAIGTTGYMDPEIEKTGGVTHKSDIYSFGVVLWEKLELLKFLWSHLKIRLADILLATDNFSETYRVGDVGFYDLYRAELEHFNEQDFVSAEEKNENELPKRRTTVIIKRIRPILEDNLREEVLCSEIEMLTACKNSGHIVDLLGFCDEGSEKILVVDDVWNVSLDYYLVNIKNMPILSWAKRLKICLDVARGLSFIHYKMEETEMNVNNDFKKCTIFLNENWRAGIFNSRNSSFNSPKEDRTVLEIKEDSRFKNALKLRMESDVYSVGVSLFEIFCGRVASDPIYTKENEEGLAYVARRRFKEGTLKEMIDPAIMEGTEGPNNNDSLDVFVKIAYRCLTENQDQGLTIKVVIKELDKALSFQERSKNAVKSPPWNKSKVINSQCCKSRPTRRFLGMTDALLLKSRSKGNILDHLNIRLSDILLATDNFSWKFMQWPYTLYHLFEAELEHFDTTKFASVEGKSKSELPRRRSKVTIKRFILKEDNKEGEKAFLTDIEMLTTCKHRNIVNLLGVCEEDSEKILVLERFPNGTLSSYLMQIQNKPILTWAKRLKICLDVAHGLNYLHHEIEDQNAKIVDLSYSVFLPQNQDDDALYVSKIVNDNPGFTDPEYKKTCKLKRESDVFGFGTILLSIFCGKIDKLHAGLAHYKGQEGLMEMIDPIMMDDRGGNNFCLNRGPDKKSLATFLRITCQCVNYAQDQRPTMTIVVEELKKALYFQEYNNDGNLRISYKDIKLATQNFHVNNRVGAGGFGDVYKGKLPGGDGTIVAKLLDTKGGQGEKQFRNELEILFEFKHENIITLVGYCDEKDAKIIVYEYAPRGSLDRYLSDARLNWMRRLKICIDVATALDVLHRGVGKQATVIHRDLKTANILLSGDWNAKLANFGLSLRTAINRKTDYVIDRACGTQGYLDPLYLKSGFLTKESDIYSFGVVLFEILCGRFEYLIQRQEGVSLSSFVKNTFDKGKLNEIVREKIKMEVIPEALTAFYMIAYRCLHENREARPTSEVVVEQLKKALKLQALFRNVEYKRSSFSHLRISLEDVLEATNNFDEKNVIGHGGLSKVYKGKLLQFGLGKAHKGSGEWVNIAARRLDNKHKRGIEFWIEIYALSRFKHENIVSLIGFCDEKGEKVIITKLEAKRSLVMYLSKPTLTWAQRLKICIDVARVLSYIHYEDSS
ncbi:uncharacterized protein [Rutidosis leptorrhynchoides]|uniref:uncharacterized protein n=1 Tax=Rutidosis leptorrhynchoides TaxID=125765 RepID=UPI003A9A4098